MAEVKQEIDEIKNLFKDFNPPLNGSEAKSIPLCKQYAKFTVDRNEIPIPEMILFVMFHILHYPTYGPEEKERWRIDFSYKNTNCSFALQKFGLVLYVSAIDQKDGNALVIRNEIIGKLNRKLTKLENKFLTHFTKDQILNHNVTIKNQYYDLENRYVYFKNRAEHAFSTVSNLNSKSKSKRTLSNDLSTLFKSNTELYYNSIAMLDAYFSFLEHLFVLIYPLVLKHLESFKLVEFISSYWSDKFTNIFDINKNAQAKSFYDKLDRVKENYRNYYAHGGFEKGGASLFIHFGNIGAIPAQLSKVKNKPHFNFFPIGTDSFTNICNTIDNFNEWLRSDLSGILPAIKFANSGLNIPCDHKNLTKIRNAMKSDSKLDALIEYYSHVSDLHANMDY